MSRPGFVLKFAVCILPGLAFCFVLLYTDMRFWQTNYAIFFFFLLWLYVYQLANIWILSHVPKIGA